MSSRSRLALAIILFTAVQLWAHEVAAMKTGFAKVNGTKLYYEVNGKGLPLVLISGGGSLDRRAWDWQFKAFARHFQVIRYDIRGIGKSERPTKTFSHSRDLYELLRFLKIERAAIVGVSFGGAIALDFAVEHADMVAALVPAASGLSSYREVEMQGALALSAMAKKDGLAVIIQLILSSPSFLTTRDAAVRSKVEEILSDNADVFISGFPLIALWQTPAVPTIQRLSEIKAPTLIIVGDKDDARIHEIAAKLETGIAGAKKTLINGAGHMVNLDKPEDFNRVVLDFLSHRQ